MPRKRTNRDGVKKSYSRIIADIGEDTKAEDKEEKIAKGAQKLIDKKKEGELVDKTLGGIYAGTGRPTKLMTSGFFIENPDLDIDDLCINNEERVMATDLFKKYLKEYDIEKVSEKEQLKQLVYFEVRHKSLAIRVNNILKEDRRQVNPASLRMVMDLMHRNSQQITSLKGSLGLIKDKKKEAVGYDALQLLKLKLRKWADTCSADRYVNCGFCGKPNRLFIRPKAWEMAKHPYFTGKILGNKTLIELFLKGKITQNDVANILEVSTDYVKWLISKWKHNLDPKLLKGKEDLIKGFDLKKIETEEDNIEYSEIEQITEETKNE